MLLLSALKCCSLCNHGEIIYLVSTPFPQLFMKDKNANFSRVPARIRTPPITRFHILPCIATTHDPFFKNPKYASDETHLQVTHCLVLCLSFRVPWRTGKISGSRRKLPEWESLPCPVIALWLRAQCCSVLSLSFSSASRIVVGIKWIKWCFEKFSQTSLMTKITRGTCKTSSSQAPPLRSLWLLIQGEPPATPRDSYQLGNIVGKHLVRRSFSSLTCHALCVSEPRKTKET